MSQGARGLSSLLSIRRLWLGPLVLLTSCVTAAPGGPPAAVEVPIQVIRNIVYVAATVNKGPTALLVVDTGATWTILTPRLIKRLGLVVPPDAPQRKMRVVGGEVLNVPFIKIATIQVGEVTMDDQEIGVSEIGSGADGLLGGDFLHRFRVTLDRTSKQMRLEPLAHVPGGMTAAPNRNAPPSNKWSDIEGEPIPLDSKDPRYKGYLDKVNGMIRSKWTYPCVKNASTGRCDYQSTQLVIEFGILKDGQVSYVRVQKTSGFAIYDEHAVSAVKAAAPFPPVPDALTIGGRGIRLVGTFSYVVEGNR